MSVRAELAGRMAPEVLMLPVTSLVPGDDFRLDDDAEDLHELAASIAEHGVLQPLLVRQVKDGWEVVAGRRRLAAARSAGLEEVPCVVRTLTQQQATDAAIAENLHRRNLSPIEEALAYAHLRDGGLMQKDIARRVGRSEGHVSVMLKLLTLPPKWRERVHRREVSYRTALDQAWRKRNKVTGSRQGGGDAARDLKGSDAAIVSHWRRRHDRLLAGIATLLKARPTDVAEYRQMIERLLKLDRQALAEDGPQ